MRLCLTRLEQIYRAPQVLKLSIKNNAEDRGRKPVGESVPAEGWIVLSIKYYDMLPLWKYD